MYGSVMCVSRDPNSPVSLPGQKPPIAMTRPPTTRPSPREGDEVSADARHGPQESAQHERRRAADEGRQDGDGHDEDQLEPGDEDQDREDALQ